jgi:hypothetical protein
MNAEGEHVDLDLEDIDFDLVQTFLDDNKSE